MSTRCRNSLRDAGEKAAVNCRDIPAQIDLQRAGEVALAQFDIETEEPPPGPPALHATGEMKGPERRRLETRRRRRPGQAIAVDPEIGLGHEIVVRSL